MKNFKASVPSNIQTKMSTLSQAIFDNWDKIVVGSMCNETQGEVRLDEIQGNYVSGWMPSQDGGFDISCWYRSDIDSSYHFTEKQTDFVNEQIKNCFESFLYDNGIDETEFNEQYDLETGNEDFRQEFCEYEMDWFKDGALFSVQMFLEGFGTYDDGEGQHVTIRSSVNYKDEYAREKYAEDIKVVTYKIEEFLALTEQELFDAFAV